MVIRIKELPIGVPNENKLLAMDLSTTEAATIKDVVYAGRPAASQAEAEEGVNSEKVMTPLTTKQSIASEAGVTIATADQGMLAETALQTADLQAAVAASTVQAPGTNTVVRQLGDRMYSDTPWSLFDFVEPAKHSAIVDGTLTGNLNVEFQRMLDSGERVLQLPIGTIPLDLNGFYPIMNTFGQKLFGHGFATKLRNAVSTGYPAVPMLMIQSGAQYAEISDFWVEARSANLQSPVMTSSGHLFSSNAITVAADFVTVDRMRVSGGFDNGIGIGFFNAETGNGTPGRPRHTTISRCITEDCGRGIRVKPEDPLQIQTQAGAGVNNLSGATTVIRDCVDYRSSQGFTQDFAAAGDAMFVNCRSVGAKKATVSSGGGQGFYIAARASMVNCAAYDSEDAGFNIDGYSINVQGMNLRAKGCLRQGFLIRGSGHKLGMIAEACSNTNPGVYPAIQVLGGELNSGSTQPSVAIELISPIVIGDQHSYAIDTNGGSDVVGASRGGYLEGNIRNTKSKFAITDYIKASSGDMAINVRAKPKYRWSNNAYTIEEFGINDNGNIVFEDDNGLALRMAMGVDPTNLVSIIQSLQAGVTAGRPLLLNPTAGTVSAGPATGATTTDTRGYFSIARCAGTPTGVPADIPSGHVAMRYDQTNNRLYIYNAGGGGWKSVALT